MDSPTLCQICNTNEFKYNCPRCNRLYCSVDCYRSPDHQQCSEAFYRECVIEEASVRATTEPRNSEEVRRMIDILKRVNEDKNILEPDFPDDECPPEEDENFDSDDDGNEFDLATRLEGIDLNDADSVWQRLTASEKQEFETLLKTGEISELLPEFRPWWEVKICKRLVEEVDSKAEPVRLEHPKLQENIPAFEILSKKPPSPCLPNNLYNILSSYACTVRFYNGEHHLTAIDAGKFLISHSATLKSNANFDDSEQAVKSIVAESDGSDGMPSWQSIASDVESILHGPNEDRRDPIYVKAALSDIYALLSEAKRSIAKDSKYSDPDFDKKTVFSVLKKIEFFLAFVYSTN